MASPKKFSAVFVLIAMALAAAPASARPSPPAAPAPEMPSAAPGAPDPFAWLEDIHGVPAEAWVKEQNGKSEAHLAADPLYAAWREEARPLYTATDRIPEPSFLRDRLTTGRGGTEEQQGRQVQ